MFKNLTDLYDRITVSNLHRFKFTSHHMESDSITRYDLEIGEEFAKLTKSWPTWMKTLKKARAEAGSADLTPGHKEKLLAILTVMCEALLDSFHADGKALSARFFGANDLSNVLHDFVLVNCRTFQFLDIFISVLKSSIQWEHSLDSTECAICQEISIEDGSLVQNTKLKCNNCSSIFHHGCLTYEEDEAKITYFIWEVISQRSSLFSVECNVCMHSAEKLLEQQRKKNLEVESVDVNDYKLRAKRTRFNYK